MKIGLVLEGGGLRGFYTMGVLDYFLEYGIGVDYVVGVSAGACNAMSFISGQRGRNFLINYDYLDDPRYLGIRSFIKTGSFFGMDFIFREIPENLCKFDRESFYASPVEHVTGVSNAETGKIEYFDKESHRSDYTILRASSSLPMISPVVEYMGKFYLDGGITEPIPVKKAFEDGCDKIIVVLTRDINFIKPRERLRPVYKRALRKYPEMIKAMDRRHKVYMEQAGLAKSYAKEGKAFIIAPSLPLTLSRYEKNKRKLRWAYGLGRSDTGASIEALKRFLEK